MQTTFPPNPLVAVVGGVAYIYVGNQRLYETKEPSFLLDRHTGTVLRYGDKASVERICAGIQESYRKNDMDCSEIEVVVFPADTTSAELLNSFICQRYALMTWLTQHEVRAA